MNRRLRDRLTISNRKRRVFVSAVTDSGGNEEMARRPINRVEDGEVPDALVMQQLDESPPGAAKLVLYGRCHQLSAEASMA